jgi:anti-anti-sigma factor
MTSIERAQPDSGVRVLRPGGRLTADAGAALDAVTGAALPASGELVIDLSRVDSVDGFGVQALVELASRCEVAGVTLRLAAPNRAIRTVFEIARLHRRMDISVQI